MISQNMKILKEEYGFDTVTEREACLQLAGPFPGQEVLDIGTGSGWMAIVLAQAGYQVTTVDIDREAMQRAKERARDEGEEIFDRIHFEIADARHLPFDDHQFDAVFSFDTMHHMPDCEAVIAESWRVGKPNGVLIIADLNPRGLAIVRKVVQESGESHYENPCRIPDIERLLQKFDPDLKRYNLEFVTAFRLTKQENPSMLEAQEILKTKKSYALIGASQNPEKYSYELLSVLKDAGYMVYPINPRYEEINGAACYPSLSALPQKPEAAIVVLAPQNSEKAVEEIFDQGIKTIWFPPGCWSDAAVEKCRRHQREFVHDICPIATLLSMQSGD